MKKLYSLIAIILIGAVLHLGAAPSKGKAPVKTLIMPQSTRTLPDLCSAGPVWKNSVPLQSEQKFHGILRHDVNPAESVKTLANNHGLKIDKLHMAENGTIAFISGDLGGISQLKKTAVPALTMQSTVQTLQALSDLRLAQNWLETFAPVTKINQAASEFFLSRYESDELGMRHLRLQQSYRGIPVWASELYVHLNARDQVYAVNGRYAPTPAGIDPDAASIDGAEALRLSRAHLAGLDLVHEIPESMKQVLRFEEPSAEKVIWIDSQGSSHLVWQVDMYASVRDWFTLFIDAGNGEVLHKINNTKQEGAVSASGLDLNNTTQNFRAYEDGGTYYMLSDINEMSGSASQLPDDPRGGVLVLDLGNSDPTEYASYALVKSSSRTSWQDKGAVSAIHSLGLINDYWKNTHGRRAIDNAASTIIGVVNVTEDNQPMGNAYWNGRAIFWGNGNQYFSPLAGALDVAAHEAMHGVTEYTANLIYQDQSGALNESMSDFFGAMVDRDDWLMGEDIIRSGYGIALRDIAQPDNPNVLSPLPVSMDEYKYTSQDNGGVHFNCGIPNRAAYLIANSIGRDKAEKIYYRAMSNYITRQSQFLDARAALEQSAIDLYGSGSELEAVKSAFSSVKVGDSGTTPPPEPGNNNVNATTGGSQWIVFVRSDLQVGLYDVANKGDFYLEGLRVKSKTGGFTQYTVTADGYSLYFINESGVLTRVDLSNLPYGSYAYETFPNIYIQSPGDLWSAAVSRDNNYIALTSNYSNDNHIYLVISEKIYAITLDIPSTQEGISRSTIRYADVLNWSPNTRYPKLAFDAFNQLTLSTGEERTWWSMGEIEFGAAAPRLYSLLPAQAGGISVGNVQYSSTDPDRIAYNYIDDNANYWDIKIANFAKAGEDLLLQFSGRLVERPSFSPDDKKLVVDNPGEGTLLVRDIATGNVTTLKLSTAAFYPEWFVIGGDYDLKVESAISDQPEKFVLKANYPNPFNAGTVISFALPHSSRVNVAIYDICGRLVYTLVDAIHDAGRHSLRWQGTDTNGQPLPSGVYLCRMQTDDGFSAVQKMVMVK